MSDKIFSCLWYDAILDDFKALFLKYKVNSKSPSSNKDSHHEDVTCNIAVCGQLVDIKTLFSIKSQQLNKVVDWDVGRGDQWMKGQMNGMNDAYMDEC